MKILVVSGFLGAGKTTFIKELIRRSGKTPVILENEYGENDLDSRALQTGELEILEFMEGCVCCTKKDSFANTILSISAAMDPEYLVVEPTGLGRLGSILDNLQKIRYDRIQILSPILILAPRSLKEHLASFPEICKDQIRHAGQILFSKAEQEDAAFLDACEEEIRRINPTANIIREHYSAQDDAWFERLFLLPGEELRVSISEEQDAAASFKQLTLKDASLQSPASLIVFLEDLLRGEFGMILRAKGVLSVGEELLRFDVADGLYGIIREEDISAPRQTVFIGPQLQTQKLITQLKAKRVSASEGGPSVLSSKPKRRKA